MATKLLEYKENRTIVKMVDYQFKNVTVVNLLPFAARTLALIPLALEPEKRNKSLPLWARDKDPWSKLSYWHLTPFEARTTMDTMMHLISDPVDLLTVVDRLLTIDCQMRDLPEPSLFVSRIITRILENEDKREWLFDGAIDDPEASLSGVIRSLISRRIKEIEVELAYSNNINSGFKAKIIDNFKNTLKIVADQK